MDPGHRPRPGRVVNPRTWRRVDTVGRVTSGALTVFTVALGVYFGVTGCVVEPSARQKTAPAVTDPVAVQQAVRRVCYAFHQYTPQDRARAAVEGDLTYLAGLQGVPADLRADIRGYWNDPNVRTPDTAAGRDAVQVAAGRVNATCWDNGWSNGLRASDQPPRR